MGIRPIGSHRLRAEQWTRPKSPEASIYPPPPVQDAVLAMGIEPPPKLAWTRCPPHAVTLNGGRHLCGHSGDLGPKRTGSPTRRPPINGVADMTPLGLRPFDVTDEHGVRWHGHAGQCPECGRIYYCYSLEACA